MYALIDALCKEQNTSVNKLQKTLGLGNGTIARWDNQDPGIGKVSLVADYFNVSLDYLVGRETPEPKLTADETELLQLFRQMSDKERQRLIGRAETIIEQEKENAKLLTSKVG